MVILICKCVTYYVIDDIHDGSKIWNVWYKFCFMKEDMIWVGMYMNKNMCWVCCGINE